MLFVFVVLCFLCARACEIGFTGPDCAACSINGTFPFCQTSFKGHNYTLVNHLLDFGSAVSHSRAYFENNGYIATVTSQEEQDFILRAYPNMSFWIGGADYYDSAGYTVQGTGYYQWTDGPEGNTYFYDQSTGNCISGMYCNILSPISGVINKGLVMNVSGEWTPQIYALGFFYLVESGGYEPPTPNITTIVFNPDTRHFYKIVLESLLFGDARKFAENSTLYGEAGYMATITSPVEHNFLATSWTPYLSPHTILLLGASDTIEKGTWTWFLPDDTTFFMDNQTIGFTAFSQGEPDNQDNRENYLEWLLRVGWNDGFSDQEAYASGYIIEFNCSRENTCSGFGECSGTGLPCKCDLFYGGTFCNQCIVSNQQFPNCYEPTIAPGSSPSQVCKMNNGGCNFQVSCSVVDTNVVCGPCPSGTVGSGYGQCITLCGDGLCNSTLGEDCVSCPRDCNQSSCGVCGDLVCDGAETCQNCLKDCAHTCEATGCNCNNHGACGSDGACVCDSLWTGPTCSTPQNEPIIVSVNSTSPTISVGSPKLPNSLFSISIKLISEIDEKGNPLRNVSLTSVSYTMTNETSGASGQNTKYTYNAVLDNGASISVMVWQFEEPATSLNFANVTTVYTQHSLKVSVVIQHWPFFSLSNSLGVILESIATDLQNTQKPNSCQNNDQDSSNLRWTMVVIDGVALYGQFLPFAEIDGRVQSISYKLNSDNTVTALLPHFWDTADMDPHYSVLVGDKDGLCGEKKISTKLLIIYIAVPVVVVILVTVLFFAIVWPRFKLWYQVKMGTKRAKRGIILESPPPTPPATRVSRA